MPSQLSICNIRKSKFPANRSQATILRAVRDLAPVSRSRLADFCGIPRPAVTRTVLSLLEKQLLINLPLADASGTRRRDGLSLNPKAGYCLSVAHSATGIDGTILNAAYQPIIQKHQQGNWKSFSQSQRLDAMMDFIALLQSHAPTDNGPCLGLAVVDSGIIDEATGMSLQSTTIENWSNVPIVETFEKRLGLPVILLNGSQAIVRVIDRLELHNTVDDLLYIQYHEGIACSIKSGSHYLDGHASLAGEFGHFKVTDDNIPCRCGATGCLEAVAALPAVAKQAMDFMAQGSDSILVNQSNFDGYDVLKAAGQGDRLASRVVHNAFSCLAGAVGGLVNVLAPTLVLFDHSIQTAGPDLVSALFLEVKRHALPIHIPHLDIRISQMSSEIGSLGGAVALLDRCLTV